MLVVITMSALTRLSPLVSALALALLLACGRGCRRKRSGLAGLIPTRPLLSTKRSTQPSRPRAEVACSGPPATDREALIALYNATDGESWERNDKWLSSESVGEWHGVLADPEGRVLWLELQGNGLRGEIPTELDNLTILLLLNLRNNQMSRCVSDYLLTPRIGPGPKVVGVDLPACTPPDHPRDKKVLVAPFDATDGESWENNDKWLSSKPIRGRYGVKGVDKTCQWGGAKVYHQRSLASVNVRASCSGEVSQRQAGSRLGG